MKYRFSTINSFLAAFLFFLPFANAALQQTTEHDEIKKTYQELPLINTIRGHLAFKFHTKMFDGSSCLSSIEHFSDLNPVDMLISATNSYQNENWLKATALYSQLISLLPEIEDYLLLMQAKSAINSGDYASAYQVVERLKKAFPNSRFYKNNPALAGDIALAGGDYPKAIDYYSEQINRLTPNSKELPLLRLNRAKALELSGDMPGAAKEYQYITWHWPAHSSAKEAGDILKELKTKGITPPQPTYANKKSYAKALRRFGMNSRAAQIYEELYKKTKDPKEKLELTPLLLDALLKANKYEETQEWLGKLPLNDLPNQIERLQLEVRLAKGLKDKKRLHELYKKFETQFASAKATRTIFVNLAIDARDSGNNQLAMKYFAKVYGAKNSDSLTQDALWQSALLTISDKDYPKALKFLDRLLNIYQNDAAGKARIEYWRGRVLRFLGREDEALAAFQNSLATLSTGYYALLSALQMGPLSAPMPVTALLVTKPNNSGNWLSDAQSEAVDQPPLCGIGKRKSPILPAANIPISLEKPAIKRIILFALLGLSEEVYAEIANLEPNAENIQLALAAGDYFHAFSWSAKLLGNATNNLAKEKPSDLLRSYFPLTHLDILPEAAAAKDIYDLLLQAIMRQESAYKPFAHSWANAYGLMQIIPITGKRIAAQIGDQDFNEARLFEEPLSINYSAWYLKELLTKYHQQLPMAIGSYNAGPKAMSRWIEARGEMDTDLFVERIPYLETRNYIKRVISALHNYCTIYEPNSVIPWPLHPDKSYTNNINF